MKKTIKLLVFAVFAYAIFLIVTLPANRLYQFFAEHIPASVKFYGLSGTVWNGEAELATLASQQYRNASWQFQWAELLKGKVIVKLDFDNGQSLIKGNAGIDVFGNYIAQDLFLQQELADIQALAQVSPVTVGGKLGGKIEELIFKSSRISSAVANFNIIDTAFLLPRRTPWGSFKVDITSPEGVTNIKIKDQGGPLLADGVITVDDAGAYDVNLAVETSRTASRDLIRGLQFLGRPGSDGKTRLAYKGNLQQLLGGQAQSSAKADPT